MKEDKEVWIFDVCETLYRSNTTFDFLEYFFKESNTSSYDMLMALRNRKTLMFWWRAILFKFFHIDLHRKKAVNLLKGHDVSVIEMEAKNFVNYFLNALHIEETFKLMNDAIKLKAKVVLVSNSIEPVIKAIARKIEVEYIATTLASKGNVYTGQLKDEMAGRKHIKLNELKITNYNVVTDNRSDYDLVKGADKRFVVIKKDKDRKFWKQLKPAFLISR